MSMNSGISDHQINAAEFDHNGIDDNSDTLSRQVNFFHFFK